MCFDDLGAFTSETQRTVVRLHVYCSLALSVKLAVRLCFHEYDLEEHEPRVLPCDGAHDLCSSCVLVTVLCG